MDPALPSTAAIDLTRFAEVMAHLRRFPAAAPGEVLARLGIEESGWEAAMAAWSRAREEELARGATELTRRFGVAFGRACKRLEAERPTLAQLGPLVGSTDPAPIATAVAGADADAAPVVAADVMAAAPSLSGTMALGAQLPLSRLPFVAGRVLPAQAFEAAVEHARVVQGPDRRAARPGATVGLSDAGPPPAPPMTLGLGVGLRRASLEETAGLPAGVAGPPPVPPGIPDLTLPQYASLRVELHAGREPEAVILGRYAVRPEARAQLDGYWRARFEADPLLRMMFAKAYATYVSWLRGGARAE
jgi:hypothetical protein